MVSRVVRNPVRKSRVRDAAYDIRALETGPDESQYISEFIQTVFSGLARMLIYI